MGCDIHAAVEVRGWGDKDWTFVAEPPTPRNYAFFGALAGVRYPSPVPLADGRGLPANTSDEARERCNGDHSDSWCTLKELVDAKASMRVHMDTTYPRFDSEGDVLDQWIALGQMMDTAHAYYGGDENDGSRTRFVFNFDS
jgi:hypothetical protein